MEKYSVPDLAVATGKDLAEFMATNQQVIGEVSQHIANLERLGGTSKAHAMGYQTYLDENYNLEEFSNHLSKRGYDISLESLAAVLLVAGSAAVIAGVGYLAYRMIKASLTKKPKAADMIGRMDDVKKLVGIVGRVDLKSTPQEYQDLVVAQIESDCSSLALTGISGNERLERALDIYMRDALESTGATNYSLDVIGKPDGALLFFSGTRYIEVIKRCLDAFRGEFVDGLSEIREVFNDPAVGSGAAGGQFVKNPVAAGVRQAIGGEVAADPSLLLLAGEEGWGRVLKEADPVIEQIRQWAATYGILPSNNQELISVMEAARDALFIKASQDRIATFSFDMGTTPTPPKSSEYDKFYSEFAEFKKVGEQLKRSAEHYRRHAKLSGPNAYLFDQQLKKAEELFRGAEGLERLLRHESVSVAMLMGSMAAASKQYQKALLTATSKMTDKDAGERIRKDIEQVAKDSHAVLSKMRMESFEERKPTLYQVMALEGRHNAVLDVLKTIAIVSLLGLAAAVMYSAVMSMFGVASFSAAWKGGLVYYTKAGKAVTSKEAENLIAEKLKEKGVGKYGTLSITSMGNALPFELSNQFINAGYKALVHGIEAGLHAFSGNLDLRGNDEQKSESVKEAAEAGTKHVMSSIRAIGGILKQAGINITDLDPSNSDSISKLRQRAAEFSDQWFKPENADYSKIYDNLNTLTITNFSDNVPAVIEAHAEHVAKEIQRFGSRMSSVDKETMHGLSGEARGMHADFTQALAFLTACTGVFTSLNKQAMQDVIRAVGSIKAVMKMSGENLDGQTEDAEEAVIDYHDPVDNILDQAESIGDLYVDEQAVIVQESWSNLAKTGVVILGILAIVGVGIMIVRSITSNKGSAGNAKSEHFDKVARGDQACNALDKLADKMTENIARIQQSIENGAFTVSAQTTSKAPDLIEHAPDNQPAHVVTPAPAAATEPVPESTPAAKVEVIRKEMEVVVEKVKEFKLDAYREHVFNNLKKLSPNLMHVDILTGRADSTVNKYLDAGRDQFMDFFRKSFDKVFSPVNVALASSNWDDRADQIYEEVEFDINALHALANLIERDVDATAYEQIMAEYDKPVTDEYLREEVAEAWKLDARDGEKYAKVSKVRYANLDKVSDLLKSAESGSTAEKFTANLEDIRGSRGRAASLLRRVEEFKPIFARIARLFRLIEDFTLLYLTAEEDNLKACRNAQVQVAKAAEDSANDVLRVLDQVDAADAGPEGEKVARELNDIQKEMLKKISDITGLDFLHK